MKLNGNILVGQSGGPTCAINATLLGVLQGAKQYLNGTIYGAFHGIDGVLKESFIDLGKAIDTEEKAFLLKTTPAAALGSCRHKLPPLTDTEFYEKVFDVFRRYEIRYFFYIGGNDSMDTVDKLSAYAKNVSYDIRINGVPKTIDNDLAITDHTPGYGSAAKYIATTMQEIARDCSVYETKAVTVVEIMGRDAGWLTVAAGLPRLYGSDTADLIYLPEAIFDYDRFLDDIRRVMEKKPNVVVAVSEGIRDKDGRYVGESSQSGQVDAFGHAYLAGAARVLSDFVKAKLGCKTRAVELNLPQRCAGHCISACDINESVMIGESAVRFASEGCTAQFTAVRRLPGTTYAVEAYNVPVCQVANQIKQVPQNGICDGGCNVTDDLLREIAPLIEGEVAVPIQNGLPVHIRLK